MESLIRTAILFIAGYLFLRLTGKKAVAQMHSFDLLYILMLTNIISSPLEVENLGRTLIYAGITVIIYEIFVRLSTQNKFKWFLYASPTVLIRNGDIDKNGLKRIRMPVNELLSQLRIKGYVDTQNIAIAVMEGTGDISVIPKSDYRPVQPNDINITVKKEYLPIPLIMDGQILDHNLKYLQLDRGWLMNEVDKKGEKIKNITLATYLENGELSIDNNEIGKHTHDPNEYMPGKDN